MKIYYITLEELNNITDRQSLFAVIFENELPSFLGGLDHYEKTKNQIKVYDRGNNCRSNDFMLRVRKTTNLSKN